MCKLKKAATTKKNLHLKKIFKFKNDMESRNTKQKGTLTIFQNRFCTNSEVDSVQEGVLEETSE